MFLEVGCSVGKNVEKNLLNNIDNIEHTKIYGNQYFTIKDLSTDGEQRYEYTIYNKNGNIVLKEKSYREPHINLLSSNLLEIMTSHGSPAELYRYYDVERDCFSTDSFWNRTLVVDNKIFYMEIVDDRIVLIVRDIFDKTKYYKEFEKDFSKTAVPSLALKSIKMIDEKSFQIKYFSGEEYKLKVEVLAL